MRMPRARREGLEVQELVDEVLVYDLERHRAHGLNKLASLVWQHCDGKTKLSTVAGILGKELHIPADPELVRFVLARLSKAQLLDEDTKLETDSRGYTRREFVRKLKKLGLAASVMLPVVTSIVAPTPAHAQTCVPQHDCVGKPNCTPCANPGGACTSNWMCCNGQCMPLGRAATECGC
jgi:hypothetical protein